MGSELCIRDSYTFSSMAPIGDLGLSWTTPSIFVFSEIFLFLIVLVGGTILIRRLNLNRNWATFNLTWIPGLPAWFIEGPLAGPFAAAFLAGSLLMVANGLALLRRSYGQWRVERLALAPDPFLEDAPAPGTEEEPKPRKKPGKKKKASKKTSTRKKDS